MTTESISTLVPSTNAGRYALDDPVSGLDVTSGQPLAVLLGGHWIEGRVEHAGNLYVSRARLFLHRQRWHHMRPVRGHAGTPMLKGNTPMRSSKQATIDQQRAQEADDAQTT